MLDEDNPKLRRLIEEATKAAVRDDWDAAVDGMRRAIAESKGPATIAAGKKNLAAVLYSRALRTADKGMGRINEASAKSTEGQIKARVDLAVRSRHRRSWKLWLTTAVIVAPIAWLTYGLYEPDEVWISAFWTRIGAVAMMTLLVTLLLRWGLVKLLDSVSSSTDMITPSGTSPKCWVCGDGAGYRIDVPGHGERLLCHQHARKLETAMQGVVADSEGVKLLRSARKDLIEAKELDPQLAEASKLLTEVRGALTGLGRS